MNLNIIKKRCNEGDSVMFTVTGDKIIQGFIVDFDDDVIVVKDSDGNEEFVCGDDIRTFKKITNTQVVQNNEIKNEGERVNEEPTQDNSSNTEQEPHEERPTLDNDDSTKHISTESQTPKEYKVGDVIPLAELQKIDPNAVKPKIPRLKGPKVEGGWTTIGGFEDLEKYETKESEKDFVHCIGIISYQLFDNYGFIKTDKGKNLYFNYVELLDIDEKSTSIGGIPVVYSISGNYHGKVARYIHKSQTVGEMMILIDNLLNNNKKVQAEAVLNHILNEYPQNFSALKKMQEINQNYQLKLVQDESFYYKARKFNDEKNYKKAIEYYKKAICQNQKIDSAIKDLGNLYASLYKQTEDKELKNKYKNETIDLISQYGDSLDSGLKKWQSLESIYYTLRIFDENYHKAIDNILSNTATKENSGKTELYLNKKAAAYIMAGDNEKAKKILQKILKTNSTNDAAQRLLSIIDAPEKKSDIEIESIISENEFDVSSYKLSAFIERTLENYETYDGVQQKIKESGKFRKDDLQKVRDLIDTLSSQEMSGRPDDRARYLLSEAKLMQQLESDNTFKLRSVMAKYCNDQAKIQAYNNGHLDVIRFYYNEAFALEGSYERTAQQVSYYLLSIIYSQKHLADEFKAHSISVDNALKLVFTGCFDLFKWQNLLNMLLYNKTIAAQIVSKLYTDENLYNQSVQAIESFGYQKNSFTKNKDEFTQAWNNAIIGRLDEFKQVVASLKSISDSSTNLEEVLKTLDNISDITKDWMCKLDKSRLSTISNIIAPALMNYCYAIGYKNKEVNYHAVKNLLSDLIKDIEIQPTKISYEGLLVLIKKIEKLADTYFQNVKETSKPQPVVTLLLEKCVVNDNLVPLQIEVAIDKDSSPIYNVGLDVVNNNDIEFFDAGDNNPFLKLIEGGDKHIFQPIVKVSDSVLEQKAIAFDVKCKYSNGGTEMTFISHLSLHLYSREEFKEIYPNPYAAVAESGPLNANSNMFFGHKTFIREIVDAIMESSSQQVIIYGQKRSGKSSVLNRVQQELTKVGAFCIQFSMGKIVRNISEFAFYYKILSEIKDSLENIEEDGNIVPEFDIPNRVDFQNEDTDNPVETFTKYMRKFKRACMKLEDWKSRRLVVLIDEFTYMYGAIKTGAISPTIMMQWKAITQDEKAQFSVVLVGQDVVPAFKMEKYAQNAFGVIKDKRLSYLDPEDARCLIVNPILMEDGKSRYIGKASDIIMDYTACNPYYIQIFCSYLVSYMNSNNMMSVTEADVLKVAEKLTIGANALDKAKFENLLNAGETEDDDDSTGNYMDNAIKVYKDADVETVLRAVAKASSTRPWANRDDISTNLEKEKEDGILKQLCARDVMDIKDNQYYKIKIRLYKEWLLNH